LVVAVALILGAVVHCKVGPSQLSSRIGWQPTCTVVEPLVRMFAPVKKALM